MTVTETAAITAIAVAGEACWATAHRTQHVMSGGTVRPPSVQVAGSWSRLSMELDHPRRPAAD